MSPPVQTSEVHAHEVLAMLQESDAFHTRESLTAAILARFGEATRFHTCSAQRMTALQLVEFLAMHGKIVRTAGGFVVNLDRVCRH